MYEQSQTATQIFLVAGVTCGGERANGENLLGPERRSMATKYGQHDEWFLKL